MSKNIAKIRHSYSAVGPTSDNSSRVALMKKVQVRVSANKAKIFGLNAIGNNSLFLRNITGISFFDKKYR